MGFLASILGRLIQLIYQITGNNYGLSIVIFTIITKLILLPLNIKQAKSTEAINKVKPQYDKIMEKYKNNKEKQAEEITKLYAENKVSPMGGCLLALIQIPLIFAMFYIVKQPLTYVLNVNSEDVRIYTAEYLNVEDPSTITDNQMKQYEIQIAKENNLLNMNFLGLNLGDIPGNAFNQDENQKAPMVTLIVPILSFVLSIVQIKLNKKNSAQSGVTEEQAEMQKSMNLMMPLLSASVSYATPLALGIYWLLGSVFAIFQQIVIKNIMGNSELKKEEKSLMLNSDKGGKKDE
ncbi:MAG: YidC/Oxa1 family membrane protein insertase [Clostridia bacterium]|nr:YidC/Oxa1 family membrane protein insertase [Clostridia bacterium]